MISFAKLKNFFDDVKNIQNLSKKVYFTMNQDYLFDDFFFIFQKYFFI